MAEQWFNADGLRIQFGRDKGIKDAQVTAVKTFGSETEVRIDFDLTDWDTTEVTFTTDRNNDGALDGFRLGDTLIPAGAVVKEAVVQMSVAGAGGTSITVGTYALNGTAIDADGLITAANGATANLTVGDQVGSGALVGTAVGADSYIGMLVTGTFTAGKGFITVKYTR